MAELSNREIGILHQEIEKQGLTYTQLQNELLDHLCCDIEAKMDEGLEFLKAFEEVRQRLENNRIQVIQEETLLLINQKYRMMKKFMYILGTIAPSLLIIFGNGIEKGNGKELVNSVETHRELLLDNAGPKLDEQINAMLDLSSEYPNEEIWLTKTFRQTPMIAAMISLSNLQFKIQFLEGELLKEVL